MPTSPAPNAGPAMCPGVAVLAGGGGAGGGDGSGNGGGDGNGGGGDGSGEGAGGDQKNAPGGKDKKGAAGEPIDVATGRVYTLPQTILQLPGPLPLELSRQYSSSAAHRDIGLGPGWSHTFAWRIEVGRRTCRVWTDEGIDVAFGRLDLGESELGPWGWVLTREARGYVLDVDDGSLRIFGEAAPGGQEWLLSSVEDRSGNQVVLGYREGRLAEVRDSVGRRIRLAADASGHVRTIEVLNATSQGRWVPFERYEYDGEHRLVAITDAEGYSWRYAYDERSLLVEQTDRVGLTFHYRYDREGRCIESWGDWAGRPDPSLAPTIPAVLADGARAKGIYHVRVEYFSNGYREVATSRQVIRYFTNAHGLVDKVVDGGRVALSTYDSAGHQLTETNALKATRKYERDTRGRLLASTDPLGRTVKYERDALGEVVRVTDPAGASTTITRDHRGLATIITDPMGATRRLVHDASGQLTELGDAVGATSRMRYDAHGNLAGLVDRHGGTWQFTYDFFGRLLSMTDPLGAVSRFHYSARGQLIASTGPVGATERWSYDGEGRPVEIIDAAGRVARLTWSGFHWLHAVTDATGRTTRARFGREGEALEIENDRGETHRFAYDLSLRLTEEQFFDGRVVRYRYDAAGQEIRVAPVSGEPIEYTYDAAGQLVARETAAGRDEYTYDVRGFLAGVASPDATVEFARDAMGRIVRETQSLPGCAPFTVDVAYDAEGRPVGRSTSLGHTLALTRSPDGRASKLDIDGRTSVLRHFDALGHEIARVLPGGTEVHSAFDPAGNLLRRLVRGAVAAPQAGPREPDLLGPRQVGTLADTVYSYDPSGRLESANDLGLGRTAYRRDAAGRLLTRIAEKGISEAFAFDATGNLLEAGPDAQAREHGPGDRLIRRGDTTYHHDACGRLVEKREGANVTRYEWNGRGLLRSVKTADGRLIEFAYDAFARRVEKRVFRIDAGKKQPVSRTRFFWDRHLPVHEVKTRAADTVVEERTYVFDGRSAHPLAHGEVRRDGDDVAGRWLHYVNDPLGTPQRLLDEHGDIAAEVQLLAWGKPVSGSERGAAATPFRFLGQQADEETGLCYNRHRYYDPETGRFISPDPIGLEGGLNAFARGADPTAEVDVFGKDVETIFPAAASPAEKKAMRDAARAEFQADPALVARQGKIKAPKNAKKCSTVADEAREAEGNHRLQMTDANGGNLKTRDDATGKPKEWDDHWVNEDKNGKIVDYDQGMVYHPPKARQKQADAMFENPAVNYQPHFGDF